ncbi:hypothetical protein RRG08_033294 [Elysia crispata]|uniref:Uncharacterized protein n=1 Tax=Elysia crispata TaxID=231223 RepID=A0AAE0XRE9_9GAST|nr:hypothetical protein RRG08_033294 [Elysia crispata]
MVTPEYVSHRKPGGVIFVDLYATKRNKNFHPESEDYHKDPELEEGICQVIQGLDDFTLIHVTLPRMHRTACITKRLMTSNRHPMAYSHHRTSVWTVYQCDTNPEITIVGCLVRSTVVRFCAHTNTWSVMHEKRPIQPDLKTVEGRRGAGGLGLDGKSIKVGIREGYRRNKQTHTHTCLRQASSKSSRLAIVSGPGSSGQSQRISSGQIRYAQCYRSSSRDQVDLVSTGQQGGSDLTASRPTRDRDNIDVFPLPFPQLKTFNSYLSSLPLPS